MIKVIVPSTTANIGTGFDTMGLALGLYNTFYVKKSSSKVKHDPLIDLTIDNFLSYLDQKGIKKKYEYVDITVNNDVPISRGLGSSATCIVGVLWGINELYDSPLTEKELLEIGIEIEGHPDNIVPCLYGGFKSSIMSKDKCLTIDHPICEELQFISLIPNFTLSTKDSRDALPGKLEYKDAVHNISRIPFLIEGFATGNLDMIKAGVEDKIHQPYRIGLIENGKEIMKLIDKLYNLPIFISGAGPTLMVVAKNDSHVYNELRETFKSKFPDWDIKQLEVHKGSITIERME
ncbi:MAG: homoserine kinase [Firmicutes bacterium]|jgi:homoserine kinase|nr:homoserine kinase [Bacillota bacterium]